MVGEITAVETARRIAPEEANSTLTVVAVDPVAAASLGAVLEGWSFPRSPPDFRGEAFPLPSVDSSSEVSTGGVTKNLEMGAAIHPRPEG